MDCQQLIVYGILLLVGIYVLKDVCGIKLPFLDSTEGYEGAPLTEGSSEGSAQVVASEEGRNEKYLLWHSHGIFCGNPNLHAYFLRDIFVTFFLRTKRNITIQCRFLTGDDLLFDYNRCIAMI